MYQRGELLGLRLTGENGDASAVAHAERGSDLLVVDKLDALALEERGQTVDVLAGIARDFAQLGKVYAIGLRNILSRDLGPARPATVLRRRVRMYSSIAVHRCLDCYAYLPCEAKFR